MSENALINIGELSKPAVVFVEKISDAVGGLFKPYQMVRVAKAEAEVARVNAESQIEIGDVHRRAMHRFLQEEATKQSNMESVTQQAIPLLEEAAAPENIQNDWITNFFDKSRIVSDEEMQKLWASVLAGEANRPGTFSRRTVNLLADFGPEDADEFTRMCGFVWQFGSLIPLVFSFEDEFYKRNGLSYRALAHLESMGLIKVDGVGNFINRGMSKKFRVQYFGRPVTLTLPEDANNTMVLGKVILTQAGQELALVCGAEPIEGFYEFVCKTWVAEGYLEKPTEDAAGEVASSS